MNFQDLFFLANFQNFFSKNILFYILNKTFVVDFEIFARIFFTKIIKNDNSNDVSKNFKIDQKDFIKNCA